MCILCERESAESPRKTRFPEDGGRDRSGHRLRPVRGASRSSAGRRRTRGHRQERPALHHPRRRGDDDGPKHAQQGRIRPGGRARRRQEDRRRRAEAARRRRGRDRRARQDRHARLHRYPPPPVRDVVAKLPRRRGADQRRVGTPSGSTTYFEYILLTFAPVYRPEDVYINELFGGLSQLDDGVTTVHDVSQIHHSQQHSDAAIEALFDTGRRAAFGYFESAGPTYSRHQSRQRVSAGRAPHQDQWFSLDRPARPYDHGRRGLPRTSDLHAGMDDRTPARPSGRGAHPLAVRHPPDPGRCSPRVRPATRRHSEPHNRPTTCSST